MTCIKFLQASIWIVVMVSLIACAPALPQSPTVTEEVAIVAPISTETPIPTITRTSTPTLTPTKKPTSTPAPTATLSPTLRPFEEFVFGDHENVALTYNTLQWQHYFTQTLGTIDNFLQSKVLATCVLRDVGATEIGPYGTTPDVVKIVNAGKFRYKAWVFSFSENNPKTMAGWYMEQGGLTEYSYADFGKPLLTVGSTVKEWSQCERDALKTLETLHVAK